MKGYFAKRKAEGRANGTSEVSDPWGEGGKVCMFQLKRGNEGPWGQKF